MNLLKSERLCDSTIVTEPSAKNGSINRTKERANTFALIDGRKLDRECFVRVIESSHQCISIVAHGSIREWKEASDFQAPPSAILFNIGGRKVSDQAISSDLERLVDEAGSTPVIVLGESEELREMIAAVDCGARGYIPASVGVDDIIEAARLTSAGGVFLPASSVRSLRAAIANKSEQANGIGEHFTSRQATVADALRRGKANKTIAYELNMCESTVKVHIRNIMKKLKATNRTQAAFKLNSLFPREQGDVV